MNFDLSLSPAVLKGIQAAGYREPTPIQVQTIPHVLAGRDVIGTAQTGTGKTAAFLLPILDRLQADEEARCLIVTPTRELADQIYANARQYGQFTAVRSVALYGGTAMNPQIIALKKRPQLIVATPGRLLDHLRRRTLRPEGFKVVVLDEADRLMDMGFLPDIRRILTQLPRQRQNLLFSATMPRPIEALARQTMDDPVRVSVGQTATPVEGVTQALYPVPGHLKTALLMALLEQTASGTTLIFTRTKRGANRVWQTLVRRGYLATTLHGDRSQQQRTQSLKGFRNGRYRILVATDVAARGLDVEGISVVINYDVPETPESYIHRIGRTARAQRVGNAWTLVTYEEEHLVAQIERHLSRALPREGLDDFEYATPPPPRSARRGRSRSRARSYR